MFDKFFIFRAKICVQSISFFSKINETVLFICISNFSVFFNLIFNKIYSFHLQQNYSSLLGDTDLRLHLLEPEADGDERKGEPVLEAAFKKGTNALDRLFIEVTIEENNFKFRSC